MQIYELYHTLKAYTYNGIGFFIKNAFFLDFNNLSESIIIDSFNGLLCYNLQYRLKM